MGEPPMLRSIYKAWNIRKANFVRPFSPIRRISTLAGGLASFASEAVNMWKAFRSSLRTGVSTSIR